MATPSDPPTRLALLTARTGASVDGAWWPQSRQLHDQIGRLFELWPDARGRIVRVLYSPPDWDDHPRSVPVPGGRVKTGSFPRDDTRTLVLSMLDGSRRTLAVVPPDTEPDDAARILRRHTSQHL
jgi:hypothetical protein